MKVACNSEIVGGFLMCFSAAEFAIGAVAYDFVTNVKVGAWWAGICPFISGMIAMLTFSAPDVGVASTACVFAIFGVIVGIIGACVDGITATILDYTDGCINTETGRFYGSSHAFADAQDCADSTSMQCACTQSSSGYCNNYVLDSGDDCGSIMSTYRDLLSVSCALICLLTALSLAHSILACTLFASRQYYYTPPQHPVFVVPPPPPPSLYPTLYTIEQPPGTYPGTQSNVTFIQEPKSVVFYPPPPPPSTATVETVYVVQDNY